MPDKKEAARVAKEEAKEAERLKKEEEKQKKEAEKQKKKTVMLFQNTVLKQVYFSFRILCLVCLQFFFMWVLK